MKRFYLVAAVAAMAFTACSNEELEPVTPPQSAVLGFSSVLTANLVTRTDAGALKQDFKFNMAAASGGFEALEEQEVTYAAATGFSVTNPVVIFAGADRTLTAWAPASVAPKGVGADANTFMLTPGVDGTTLNVCDFVYQTQKTVTSTDAAAINLTMKHAMAKITFKIEFPVAHTTPKEISKLVLAGTPGASEFNIFSDTWGTPAVAADITVINASDDASKSFEALVVPMETVAADALKVTCTINGHEYAATSVGGITKLDKATNYVVTLKVSGNALKITGVSVDDWTDSADNGEVIL